MPVKQEKENRKMANENEKKLLDEELDTVAGGEGESAPLYPVGTSVVETVYRKWGVGKITDIKLFANGYSYTIDYPDGRNLSQVPEYEIEKA